MPRSSVAVSSGKEWMPPAATPSTSSWRASSGVSWRVSPQRQCLVLSKDQGVDPVLRHLNKTGLQCHRLHSLLELDPKAAAPPEAPHDKRVLEVLGKSEKKSRPRKRNTLSQHIASIFQKKLPPAEVDRLIDSLLANTMSSETNATIA